MIKLILTDKDLRKPFLTGLSIIIGIVIGYYTLPFLIDHKLIKINSITTQTGEHYINYGIIEENYTTNKYTNKDIINIFSTLTIQILIGTLTFFITKTIFTIIEIIINKITRE